MDRLTLDALKQSLLSGATAQGSMGELDLQRERANSLRDTPLAQGGRRSGYVSPFMIAANTAQRLSGEREGRKIGKQREGLSQAVAQAGVDNTMYGYGVEQDERDLSQQNTEAKAAASLQAASLAEQNKRRAAGITAGERAGKRTHEDRMAPDGTVKQVTHGNDGKMYVDGVHVPDASNWPEAPSGPLVEVNTGAEPLRAKLEDQLVEYNTALLQTERVLSMSKNLSPEMRDQLNSTRGIVKELGLELIAPEKVEQAVLAGLSDRSNEAKQFFVALSRLSSAERHELFGSALTKTELESSGKFLSAVSGLPLDEIERRLQDSADSILTKIQGIDRTIGTNAGAEAVARGQEPGNYPGAPEIGTVTNGYEYNGGDPATSEGWSKQ
jgi:hypothetical protein